MVEENKLHIHLCYIKKQQYVKMLKFCIENLILIDSTKTSMWCHYLPLETAFKDSSFQQEVIVTSPLLYINAIR